MKYYLGPGIIGEWGILPFSGLFNIAGHQHDIGYSIGGTHKDKKRVDDMFLTLMLLANHNRIHKATAYFYFYMVRIFGFLFFKYK